MCGSILRNHSSSAERLQPDGLLNISANLNNIGVDLLLSHHEDIASTVFQKTLESLRLAMYLSGPSCTKEDLSRNSPEVNLMFLYYQQLVTDLPAIMSQDSSNSDNADQQDRSNLLLDGDKNDMVYTHPMKICLSKGPSGSQNDESTRKIQDKELTSIILYNTALAYHIQGVKRNQRNLLVSASKMYSLVYRSISGMINEDFVYEQSTRGEGLKESFLLPLLASLNNAALLHHENGSREEGNDLFRRIMDITCMMPADTIQNSVVVLFVMNAIAHQSLFVAPSA